MALLATRYPETTRNVQRTRCHPPGVALELRNVASLPEHVRSPRNRKVSR